MTNQGELVNQIMKAGSYHEEYLVTVDKPVTEVLQSMQRIVPVWEQSPESVKGGKRKVKRFSDYSYARLKSSNQAHVQLSGI